MTLAWAEVIGDPVSHSKSPLIHRFWLDALRIVGDYRACRVGVAALGGYLASRIEDPDWRGCNVTLPHKIAILDYVADPGGIRDTIGAANTVFRDDTGQLICTNTDAAGFYAPIATLDLAGKPVMVIGNGGAAHAVLFALARANAGPVTVIARNPLKAMALLQRFGLKGEVRGHGAPLPPAALLVNASPLGMTGQPPLEIDLSPLPENAVVYDLVYAPLETPLLRQAHEAGLETVDGLDMLIGQAALAFELFFGQPTPRDRDDALRALLTA